MRVLLLSMPDSFEHTPALAIRMPNGALASWRATLIRITMSPSPTLFSFRTRFRQQSTA
jgi:hypothetical protein